MIKYHVCHKMTGKEIVRNVDSLNQANSIVESMGDDFVVTSWLAFAGVPHVNVVLSKSRYNDCEQVEGVFMYASMANAVVRDMNAQGGDVFVRKILLNCSYPHGGDGC